MAFSSTLLSLNRSQAVRLNVKCEAWMAVHRPTANAWTYAFPDNVFARALQDSFVHDIFGFVSWSGNLVKKTPTMAMMCAPCKAAELMSVDG
eukprot:m.75471 g.75471  ORF g.75471 m.75471 type:complete len:92 (-) comp12452_c1_seq2:1438-1713(-)